MDYLKKSWSLYFAPSWKEGKITNFKEFSDHLAYSFKVFQARLVILLTAASFFYGIFLLYVIGVKILKGL